MKNLFFIIFSIELCVLKKSHNRKKKQNAEEAVGENPFLTNKGYLKTVTDPNPEDFKKMQEYYQKAASLEQMGGMNSNLYQYYPMLNYQYPGLKPPKFLYTFKNNTEEDYSPLNEMLEENKKIKNQKEPKRKEEEEDDEDSFRANNFELLLEKPSDVQKKLQKKKEESQNIPNNQNFQLPYYPMMPFIPPPMPPIPPMMPMMPYNMFMRNISAENSNKNEIKGSFEKLKKIVETKNATNFTNYTHKKLHKRHPSGKIFLSKLGENENNEKKESNSKEEKEESKDKENDKEENKDKEKSNEKKDKGKESEKNSKEGSKKIPKDAKAKLKEAAVLVTGNEIEGVYRGKNMRPITESKFAEFMPTHIESLLPCVTENDNKFIGKDIGAKKKVYTEGPSKIIIQIFDYIFGDQYKDEYNKIYKDFLDGSGTEKAVGINTEGLSKGFEAYNWRLLSDNFTLEARIEMYRNDFDNNGGLDESEFAYLMTKIVYNFPFVIDSTHDMREFRAKVLEFYDLIDCNGDSAIDCKEISKIVNSLKGIESLDGSIDCIHVNDFVSEADTDGNGVITSDEFVLAIMLGMWEAHYLEMEPGKPNKQQEMRFRKLRKYNHELREEIKFLK